MKNHMTWWDCHLDRRAATKAAHRPGPSVERVVNPEPQAHVVAYAAREFSILQSRLALRASMGRPTTPADAGKMSALATLQGWTHCARLWTLTIAGKPANHPDRTAFQAAFRSTFGTSHVTSK